jgi:hypothetical protein
LDTSGLLQEWSPVLVCYFHFTFAHLLQIPMHAIL